MASKQNQQAYDRTVIYEDLKCVILWIVMMEIKTLRMNTSTYQTP